MNNQKNPKIKKLIRIAIPKGLFELSNEQVDALKNIGETILGIGAVLGVIAITAIAPNALRIINKAKWAKKTYRSLGSKKQDQRKKITSSFYYLKRQGMIELKEKDGNYLMKLTEKGRKRVQKMSLRALKINRPKKWDGFWWMVIADIPIELRSQAHSFRNKLKQLGLFTLQRSVWVYPFDPRNEIAFIAALNGLDRYITTFKASDLESEDETSLKKFFNVKY